MTNFKYTNITPKTNFSINHQVECRVCGWLRILILTLLLPIWQPNSVLAQISTPGSPRAGVQEMKQKKTNHQIVLPAIRESELKAEDKKLGIDNRYSVYQDTLIDLLKEATSIIMNDGTLYTLEIKTPGARSLSFWFGKYRMPVGGELYLYDSEKKRIHGAYTALNNKSYNALQISDFKGDNVIIEYFEPNQASFQADLIIYSIGRAYREVHTLFTAVETNESLIDVNCQHGDDWQLEKHAVARMFYKEGTNGFYCTGSLINNTANDGTPYFLTANHCISTDTVAKTLITYFNYEQATCGGSAFVSTLSSISGATLKATSGRTDFSLLLLSLVPPLDYQPYYAGWNAIDAAPHSAVSIHHPSGLEKKISIEDDSIISYPSVIYWDGNESSLPHTHWEVGFDVGETRGGSSGGPLFDDEGRIIGQLHGGAEGIDYYGKISGSFEGSSSLNIKRLKPWLDSLNSGVRILNGYYPPGVKPDAHFSADIRTACLNAPVQLLNKSVFSPNNWKWTISPSTITYLNGTSDTSNNPVISFNESGVYGVELQAFNESGENIQNIPGYILIGDILNITSSVAAKEICFYNKAPIEIIGSGAIDYKWVTESAKEFFDFSSSNEKSIHFSIKNEAMIDSTIVQSIYLVGSHGECTDTLAVDLRITYPFNDEITNAYSLQPGLNGPFSNRCATIQFNEPYPPVGDCTSQLTWCDEYRNGTSIIENTLWFSFTGPESGIIAVNSDGFDDQMAIYEAKDVSDIMKNDPRLYTIIAANDDHEDEDYSSTIERAEVVPGKTYWLQIDGSGGGSEGTFTLELFDYPVSSRSIAADETKRGIQIFPNPTNGEITIHSNVSGLEIAELKLYDIRGKIFYNSEINNTNNVSINISSFVNSPGIYILSVRTNQGIFKERLFIQR